MEDKDVRKMVTSFIDRMVREAKLELRRKQKIKEEKNRFDMIVVSTKGIRVNINSGTCKRPMKTVFIL